MNAAEIDIDITRHDDGWPEDSEALIVRAIRRAAVALELAPEGPAELSVLLTNDAEQAELNQQWRGKSGSTNVLSFPQIDPFGAVEGLLGDITIARETVQREAEELGKSFADHLTHLAVHGFLHILGYDHIDEAEAETMERLETDILASLEIDDPYADT